MAPRSRDGHPAVNHHPRAAGWPRTPSPGRSARSATGSATRALVAAGDWKLVGAVAYYAFDNAVLWAAFHAFGRPPAIGVVVMGYLVGSLAGALPLPVASAPWTEA